LGFLYLGKSFPETFRSRSIVEAEKWRSIEVERGWGRDSFDTRTSSFATLAAESSFTKPTFRASGMGNQNFGHITFDLRENRTGNKETEKPQVEIASDNKKLKARIE
jgi:hypothetical protein